MKAEPTAGTNQPPDLSSLCLAITEHAPLPMATVEGASHIVRYVNPAFCRLMDKPTEQLVGKPFAEMMPEKDECLTLLDRVYRTGKSESHTEQEHSEPRPVFWSYTMWPVMADERPVGVMIQVTETAKFHGKTVAMNEALMLGSVRQHELTEAAESLNAQLFTEIAERKRAEQRVRRSELRYRRLFEAAQGGILILDPETRKITDANPYILELLGYTNKQIIGKELWEIGLLKDKEASQKAFLELKAKGFIRYESLPLETKADQRREVEFVSNLYQENGEAVIQCNIRDITERKRAEEALLRAQAQLADRAGQLEQAVTERTAELTATNKQLEAFVYSIAHDLRAPLRSMQGFSAMLVEDAGTVLSETGRDFANRINKSAQFMDALLIDLLAFSRIAQQRIELDSVNLETVVRSALSRLDEEIQEKNARVEIAGPWPPVLAHEPTLGQVIFNLVSNALKFAAPDVPPVVRVRAEERAAGVSPSPGGEGRGEGERLSGSWVRVWVEDNGIGIALEHQEQIFRLFTRLHGDKFPGTGIGLAIVQKGVERMDGNVGVESTPGQGSRFWFELRKAGKI